jgi:hypothetical protein
MSGRPEPIVVCRQCGRTAHGRVAQELCNRCRQKLYHPMRHCDGCGAYRRHVSNGFCAECYRKSRTVEQLCDGCGEVAPTDYGKPKCQRCVRRAGIRMGNCTLCGRSVARLYGGKCRPCQRRVSTAIAHCQDCGELGELTCSRCRGCYSYLQRHAMGTCTVCAG